VIRAKGVTSINAIPLMNETLAIFCAPIIRKAVRTPFGNVPAGGETVNTSPLAMVAGPETTLPLTDKLPLLTDRDSPTCEPETAVGIVNAVDGLAFRIWNSYIRSRHPRHRGRECERGVR
jgi:hypothetical protein